MSYNPIPARAAACYWTNWDPLTLAQVSPAYNLIFLFQAQCAGAPPGTDGSMIWAGDNETVTQLKADIAARRATGTCVILTCGGVDAFPSLTTRARSTAFVNSIYGLYDSFGPFDGVDLDCEVNAYLSATEITWIAQQFKATYGTGFHVTWAAAGTDWITNGPGCATAMLAAGVLDLIEPMCYDWDLSTEAAKITASQQMITSWHSYVPDASMMVIGVQLPNADDGPTNTFSSYTSANTLWDWALATYPAIRGMDVWNAYEDARATGGSGGTFVSQVIPRLSPSALPVVTGVSPLSGPAAGGTTVTITGTSFTGATSVAFGTAHATSLTVNSATQLTVTSPAGSGTVDVTVTTPGGTSAVSPAALFTYTSGGGGGGGGSSTRPSWDPSGAWTQVFGDEFDGTGLDGTKWTSTWFNGGSMNGVSTSAANVSFPGDSCVHLRLASTSSGALICTDPSQLGAGKGFQFGTGYAAEARCYFPGSGSSIYNWPAWWTDGQPTWPAHGEFDIAEGRGTMHFNYIWTGVNDVFNVPGSWSGWHTFGFYRTATALYGYYDGVLVHTFSGSENGSPHFLIFNVGQDSSKSTTVTGPSSDLLVDWVRVWTPGGAPPPPSGITQDASTPAASTWTGSTAGSYVTGSFSPPAHSLVAVPVGSCFLSADASPAFTVADSAGNTYAPGPAAFDGVYAYAGIFTRYYVSAPGTITVTASRTGMTQAGVMVAPVVLDGCSPVQGGGGSGSDSSSGADTSGTVTVARTAAGSWVLLAGGLGAAETSVTPNGATATLAYANDTADTGALAAGKSAAATTVPGAAAFGWSWPAAGTWALAGLEIMSATAVSGTVTPAVASGSGNVPATAASVSGLAPPLIAQDPSTPAASTWTGSTGTGFTTGPFSPPARSLAAVLVQAWLLAGGDNPAFTVADSAGNTYAASPPAWDGTRAWAGIFTFYYPDAPGPVTVTASRTGAAPAGVMVAPVVLTGCSPAQGGGSAQAAGAGLASTVTVTTTAAGSWVLAASAAGEADAPPAPAATTVTVASLGDDADDAVLTAGRSAAPTGTPGATDFGWSW